MAYTVNRITLKGRLGRDAETKVTINNNKVSTFSIATDHGYQKKGGSDWVNETTWHDVVAWSLSDNLIEMLKKGKEFYVEGRYSKRKYTNKAGVEVTIAEVVAEKVFPCFELIKSNNSNSSAYSSNNRREEPEETYSDNGDLPF